jgi:hypothetical protein
LWDRWEYKNATKATTLADILNYLDSSVHFSKLEFRDVFSGSTPVFMHSLALLQSPSLTSIMECDTLGKPVFELLGLTTDQNVEFVDLTITFVEKGTGHKDESGNEQILKNLPGVRVYFQSANVPSKEEVEAYPAPSSHQKMDTSD